MTCAFDKGLCGIFLMREKSKRVSTKNLIIEIEIEIENKYKNKYQYKSEYKYRKHIKINEIMHTYEYI